ncbi:hypothetical protein BI347_12630 [Chromobacterium sphagni]|uniref:Ricin B lectin domain-containing protein n=1 Tax=Chromobacterium sphagni TaxID=1903179 RepID=A0A1S1X437_9NEIS|nr:hypothetical protein BI347_12630 [Chromobacterium sphagni]
MISLIRSPCAMVQGGPAVKLKTVIPVLLLSLAPLAQAAGKTPGSYTHYRFPAGVKALDAVDFTTTVNHDPGDSANVYWANQFDLVGTSGAYAGMQSNGGRQRTFLFSAWDTTDARPGSPGSYCTSFSGEGEGRSCRIHVDWTHGHAYQFHVAYEGGGWLGVTVNDLTSKTSFKLGSIKTASKRISPNNMVNWTEYFEWNNSRSTCLGQPYSQATFAAPAGMVGGKPQQAVINGSETSKACLGFSNVTVSARASVQENGIGNSARGALANRGLCLEASNGLQDGSTPLTSVCNGSAFQSWVWARDQSLQLQNNYCLEENGSGVEVRTCSGASGWNLGGGQIRSQQSGLCLSANRPGQRPSLLQCSDAASQAWSQPPLGPVSPLAGGKR